LRKLKITNKPVFSKKSVHLTTIFGTSEPSLSTIDDSETPKYGRGSKTLIFRSDKNGEINHGVLSC
jgi:hypothetical protein